MRKNTLIKLLAVLAMCFLIGAALVSCGEEEVDETAKTIVGVEFVGDELVITYEDGTKTTTAIPAAAACKHENAIPVVTERHKLMDNGKISKDEVIYVCNDCGFAKVEYLEGENLIHVASGVKETKAPTCVADGYSADFCLYCGVKFNVIVDAESAKTGHTLGAAYYSEGNACVGGKLAKNCANCDYIEYTDVAKNANEGFDGVHTVAEWNITKDPTFKSTGTIVGTCTEASCKATLSIELPKLTEKKDDSTYKFAIADPRESCKDSGTYTYTHKATGKVVTVVENGTADHYLEGKLMTPSTAANKVIYRVEDFKKDAIIELDNHKIVNCYDEQLAIFYCDAKHDNGATCKEPVTIYAAKAHTASDWMDDPNNTATCEKAGKEIKICTVCKAAGINTVLETRDKAKLPHDIVYRETLYADANGAAVLDITKLENVGAKAYRFGDCSKCDHTQYDEVADFKSEITVKTTCQAPGKFTVTYTKVSGEAVKQDFVIAQLAHKLNGIELVLHTDATPKIYTVAELKAIKADVVLIEPDNTDPNLNYDVYAVQCDCVCECPAHFVSIRVAK